MHRTWTIRLKGDQHTVELDLGSITCRGTVSVDGVVARPISQSWRSIGSDHPFDLAGHAGVIHLRQGWAGLSVDGLDPATGVAATIPRRSSWGYFALGIVCVTAPAGASSTFGLAVVPAAVIGGLGTTLIMAVERRPWPGGRRAATALGLAAMSLVASFGTAIAINSQVTVPSDRPVASWQRYSAPSSDISAALPASPSTSTQVVPNAGGSIELHVSEADDAHASFGFAYGDLVTAPSDPGAVLDGVAQLTQGRIGGQITTDVPIEYAGVTGREFHISGAAFTSGTTRTLWVRYLVRGAHLYEVIAAVPATGGANQATITAFFDSVRFASP